MKKYIYTIFVVVYTFIAIGQSPCSINGITTHPNNPVNPIAPSPVFLNFFNWFENNGTSLPQFSLTGMQQYGIVNQMVHPWSEANGFGYLNDGYMPLNRLDMYPEDGWELFSINLGSYPDGTPLAQAQPPLISAHPEIPYIMLYNKNRGILRLFANTTTGLNFNNFDAVVVRVEFFSPNANSSGLLRHNGGYDRALDTPTPITYVESVVKHPNNPTKWFHTDFQFGYDPCTCMRNSQIIVKFRFSNEMTIQMTSRGIYTDVPLVTPAGGNFIPNDFLSGVKYTPGFNESGLLVYSTMNTMINDYITKLEHIQNYNGSAGANSTVVKRKKFILKALKFVLEEGLDEIPFGNLADSLTSFCSDIIQTINPDGSVVIKKAKLKSSAKSILGQGMDWLSKEWINEPIDKLATPTMPTATISETTFDGVISELLSIEGPRLFNPGIPASVQNNVEITPHNYPVYNEVLGLFALLKTPKFNYTEAFSQEIISEEFCFCDQIEETFKTDRRKHLKFWLSEPLKYVFNPAAGIDMANVRVEASLVVKYESKKQQITEQWQTFQVPDPTTCSGCTDNFQIKGFAGTNKREVYLDNFQPEFLYGNPTPLSLSITDIVQFATPFLPIDNFNDLRAYLGFSNTEKWKVRTFGASNVSRLDAHNHWRSITTDVKREDLVYELKLMVTMPFIQPGHLGQQLETSQVFTYRLNPNEDFILIPNTSGNYPIQWSLTNSPMGGNVLLQDELVVTEKYWTIADAQTWGLSADNTIRVYATDNITIIGHQSHDNSIAGVEFIAPHEVSVENDAILYGNITLRLEDFVGMTATPTPTVTQNYLQTYCQALQPGLYLANQSTRAAEPTSAWDPTPPERLLSNVQCKLYPNPAQDELLIYLKEMQGVCQVSVYSAQGQIVWERLNAGNAELDGSTLRLDVAGLSAGVYHIRCNTERDTVVRSFVVQRE